MRTHVNMFCSPVEAQTHYGHAHPHTHTLIYNATHIYTLLFNALRVREPLEMAALRRTRECVACVAFFFACVSEGWRLVRCDCLPKREQGAGANVHLRASDTRYWVHYLWSERKLSHGCIRNRKLLLFFWFGFVFVRSGGRRVECAGADLCATVERIKFGPRMLEQAIWMAINHFSSGGQSLLFNLFGKVNLCRISCSDRIRVLPGCCAEKHLFFFH